MIGDTLYLSTSYNRVIALDANSGTRALVVRSQGVCRGPAAEWHGIRAPWGRDVDRWHASPDLHEQPVESHRARRGDGTADSLVRRHGRRRSDARAGEKRKTGQQVSLHADVAARRLEESRHRRQRGCRPSRLPERSAGRRPGVRRKDRQARVELQPGSAQRARRRGEIVGERVVEDDRPHERVGAVQRRRSPRPDLPAGEHAEQRLVRRRAQRRRPVRRIDRLSRREQRARRVWHFQTVHHGLWDYDLPAAPVLATIQFDGRPRDVVAVPTKTGLPVRVRSRRAAKPIWPIEERSVPQSDVPGEAAAQSQPVADASQNRSPSKASATTTSSTSRRRSRRARWS